MLILCTHTHMSRHVSNFLHRYDYEPMDWWSGHSNIMYVTKPNKKYYVQMTE